MNPEAALTTETPPPAGSRPIRVALLGNPNTGKSTLFNRLCGLRQRTSNFPGTTQEVHLGLMRGERGERGQPTRAGRIELIDMPGVYSLALDRGESHVCQRLLDGSGAGGLRGTPDAVCVVTDATNLPRNLALVVEAIHFGLPVVMVINMLDEARRRGIHADERQLAASLGCPVFLCSARTGEGLDALRSALGSITAPSPPAQPPPCGSDPEQIERWVERLCIRVGVCEDRPGADRLTDRIDAVLTHPLFGLIVFAMVMGALFYATFKLATYPMDWISVIFTHLGGFLEGVMPAGVIRDLLARGVVSGVGATVVFLPQICLLFFLISVLEGTGYLARAALLMDRALRPFGLSGHAFVPLLSAHACAIPAIMAARGVPDPRDRLATILVAPFMSCSARIPVYVLLTVLLFPGAPGLQALAFAGCYALGIAAGIFSALLARRTILRGGAQPLAIELPPYRVPSLRTSLLIAWDRGVLFLRNAGTMILAIAVVLWWLGSFPIVEPPPEALEMREQAATQADPALARSLLTRADQIQTSDAARRSFIGRIGAGVEPVFRPLGYDRQLTIGVLASFAAREVFVSTMAIVATGRQDVQEQGVFEALSTATRDDGRTPVFNRATNWSLLVYYVLAMQCLPTLVVTTRQTGSWKWAGVQLAWMLSLAYVAAMVTYRVASALG